CGGSLVAPNKVLTAAHCEITTYASAGEGTIAYVNFHDRTGVAHDATQALATTENVGVASVVNHPQYDSNTVNYDFAILTLPSDSQYTPVVLDFDDANVAESGENLRVMGFGTTTQYQSGSTPSPNPTSAKLLEVTVPGMAYATCVNTYGGLVRDTMLCAGASGLDACQGDSGGPLIRVSDSKQVGVVSYGYGCAWPNNPGVYARVTAVKSWMCE
ncbi:uncharacterized protein MICPUCDRAFT_13559, partial [Micromonas pusilla CCMP1545]